MDSAGLQRPPRPTLLRPYSYTINDYAVASQDNQVTVNCHRLVFRLRYNVSTGDCDPYATNSSMDYDSAAGVFSPIEQNAEVNVGVGARGLQLAINTTQTGRTFQDRSHTFLVCKRPDTNWATRTVYNVNVRGKRGNIVQTFPATEYDFEPQNSELPPNVCMHFQEVCADVGSEECIIDPLLTVSAAFRGGLVCCVNSNYSGDCKNYAFLSTRNNNSSNRAQKLKTLICDASKTRDPKYR